MSTIRSTLEVLSQTLYFRRVHNPDLETLKVTGYDVFCQNEACVNGDELELAQHYEPGKLPEEYKKPGFFNRFVEVTASFFKGVCKPQATKFPANDVDLLKDLNVDATSSISIDSRVLTYSSTNNFFLNLETGNWENLERRVVPRDGDLICGLVDGDKFTKWFICSEQFCRTIMLLRIAFSFDDTDRCKCDVTGDGPMFDDARRDELEEIALEYPYFSSSLEEYNAATDKDLAHAEEMGITLEPKLVRESLYRNLFRNNNTTIGSAVYKKIAAIKHNGTTPLTFKELQSAYSRSRCESYTRRPDCVHLYSALVMLFFYREPLTLENVPKNIFKNPKPWERTEVTLEWVVPSFIKLF